MKILSLATIAVAAILATGQSTPVPDACIIDCTEQVCVSLTNFTCFCSPGPQQVILACLQANCTAADLTTADQLDQLECNTLSRLDLTCLGPSSSSSVAAASASAAPSSSVVESVSTTTAVTSATSVASYSPSSSVAVFTSSAPIVISKGGVAGLLAIALCVAVGIII